MCNMYFLILHLIFSILVTYLHFNLRETVIIFSTKSEVGSGLYLPAAIKADNGVFSKKAIINK